MKIEALVEEMNKGEVAALIMYNVNPAYDYVNAAGFIEGLKKTGLSVSLADVNHETAKLAHYVCPDHHYLESWNDAEAYTGMFTLQQPTIRHLFDTRQAQDSFLKWAGMEGDFHSYMKKYWENNLFNTQEKYLTFNDFWTHTLQDGVFELEAEVGFCPMFDFAFLDENTDKLKVEKPEGLELVLYEKIGIGDGKQANNPWLQEMPDPITKAVWDNYVAISPKWAKENGYTQEDLVSINGIELPVMYQPGQPYGTVSIALGYGRENAGKVASGIGKNVFGLAKMKNNSLQFSLPPLHLRKQVKLTRLPPHKLIIPWKVGPLFVKPFWISGKKRPLAVTNFICKMKIRPLRFIKNLYMKVSIGAWVLI